MPEGRKHKYQTYKLPPGGYETTIGAELVRFEVPDTGEYTPQNDAEREALDTVFIFGKGE